MRIVVNVKKAHILKGECKSPQRCAIAAAIRDEYENVSYVAVQPSRITLTRRLEDGSGYREHYAVPIKAAKTIIAFDAGECVRPFVFTAKLIDSVTLKPRTKENRDKNRTDQAKKRARMAMAGKKESRHYGRISGV